VIAPRAFAELEQQIDTAIGFWGRIVLTMQGSVPFDTTGGDRVGADRLFAPLSGERHNGNFARVEALRP